MRADPDVLGVVNTGHRCDSENIRLPMWKLSIAILIMDLNVHRWSATKLMSIKSHVSRSVASDGLTKCIQAMVPLNIYKNSANKFGRKTGFKIENEIEDQDQSIPKLIGILTQVFCTFDPNLVILASGLHKVEIGLGTKFQYQFSAWFSRTFHAVSYTQNVNFKFQKL